MAGPEAGIDRDILETRSKIGEARTIQGLGCRSPPGQAAVSGAPPSGTDEWALAGTEEVFGPLPNLGTRKETTEIWPSLCLVHLVVPLYSHGLSSKNLQRLLSCVRES